MKPTDTDLNSDLIEELTIEDLQALVEAKKKMAEEDDKEDEDEDKSDDDEDLEEAKKVAEEDCDDEDEDKDLEEAKKVAEEDDKDEDLEEAFGKKDDDEDDDADGKDDDNDGKADDDDNEADDDDSKGEDKDKPKPAFLKKIKKESAVDFASDLASITESDDSLSEEFKEKVGVIFEVALTTRVREEVEAIQEDYDNKLNEEKDKFRQDLEEKIDNYLTYAVESWVEDNKIAVEGGLRTEVAESFIDALKHVFVEHYIEVPETKKDIVSELETKLNIAEEALSASSTKTEELNEQVNSLLRAKILAEAAESLADTQQARLTALVEGIEFVDAETFTKKVATIKECYFKGKAAVIEEEPSRSYKVTEVIVEEDNSDLSPTMQKYVTALGRINKATNLAK